MSEYQYFEFQAIDRPLNAREMAALRARSTRARITPTSFVNEYHWGDFKGDPDAWMAKYFDAFLYLTNWGIRTFKLRLPSRLISPETMRLYCDGEIFAVRRSGAHCVLTYNLEEEPGGDWAEGTANWRRLSRSAPNLPVATSERFISVGCWAFNRARADPMYRSRRFLPASAGSALLSTV